MWKRAIHRMLGPSVSGLMQSRFLNRWTMPVPEDLPTSHGSGPDPDRILLMGGLVVRGLGVASYDLGIAGNLARQLAARTGRGADVEARGIPSLTTQMAVEELRSERLERYDLLLLMVGAQEVLSFRSRRQWRYDLDRLFDALRDLVPATLPVMIAGVPPFALDLAIPAFAQRGLMHKIINFNADTRDACEATSTVEFVAIDPVRGRVVSGLDSNLYSVWAAELAPAVGRALEAAAPGQGAIPDLPAGESLRQKALDELHVIGSGPNASVNRIVEMARNVFGVSGASVTLLDYDRQWIKSASGISDDDTLRSEAFCNTTIQHPGAFIVEDVADSPGFRDAGWVAGPEHVRFYAGYPLEAPGGQRVGALCVMDRDPRTFGPADVTMLRDLALRAQDALWAASRVAAAPA